MGDLLQIRIVGIVGIAAEKEELGSRQAARGGGLRFLFSFDSPVALGREEYDGYLNVYG